MITAKELTQWMSDNRSSIAYNKVHAEDFINEMKSMKGAEEFSIDRAGDLFTDWLMSLGLEEEVVL